MTQIPTTMKAFTQDAPEDFKVSVKEVPVPRLSTNELLVKVDYYAQNPTDWKHSMLFSPKGAIFGFDFCGTIVSLGSDLKESTHSIGDRVAGVVHGGLISDEGSCAEYARVESDLCWKVPKSMKGDEASTFGVAWTTACQGHDWPPAQPGKDQWFLLYGASSSVGLFVIQLAKFLGYRVLAICSPHSYDLVKSYGASETIDYHIGADKVAEEVKRISGGGVKMGMDTISEGDSYKIALAGYSSEGGVLNHILPASKEVKAIREDVELKFTLMYFLFGKEFNMNPRHPDGQHMKVVPGARELHVELSKRTPELIEKYGLRGNPVEVRNGLESIMGGFQDMRDGKVSGKKLVYKISSEKGHL